MQAPDQTMDRWIRPSVILVATDLSELDRLMPFAFEQAAQTGARLLLLHVLAAPASMAADAAGMPYYDPAGAVDFAAKTLEPWCVLARQQNLACDALVREGNASQQIGAAARQFQADRLLLGTRSRSKLGKLLLGSVAEQVLRSVNLPVITVGPEAHLPVVGTGAERVVLHATTLRETSRPSAALACQIAGSLGAKLVLLHVLPPSGGFSPEAAERSGQPASLDSAALHELRILAAVTGAACAALVEPHVVHGNPAVEILAMASERRASLVVLGARHRSVFEDLTRDRTIYRVLAHARCPVLTLREAETKPVVSQMRQFAAHL
ncbi:MAG TPA: universal stress protein [Terracidiphilus sp.]|nr:universal stress protein [Terracidiphilus sp.]